MPEQQDLIRQAVERYEREYDRYSKLTNRVAEICRIDVIEDNAIRANVTYRTKSPKGFEGKLQRLMANPTEQGLFTTGDAIFERIGDLSGVRVLTYEEQDRDRVVDLIKRRFDINGGSNSLIDRKDSVNPDAAEFYRATHCDVRLVGDDLAPPNENLRGVSCEIQVCSMLAHVWNEVEHDLVYKPLTGNISEAEKDALKELGHLTISADIAIKQLYEATSRRQKEEQGRFDDVHDFVIRIRDRFPRIENFSNNSLQLFEELKTLNLDSPEMLEPLLVDDFHERAGEILRNFNAALETHGDGFRLDSDSSDILLMLLLEQHAAPILDNHPVGRGQGRPPRIRSVALRFTQYREELRPE